LKKIEPDIASKSLHQGRGVESGFLTKPIEIIMENESRGDRVKFS
jgi:hypothetical protein